MKLKFTLSLLFVLGVFTSFAQSLSWVRTFGGNSQYNWTMKSVTDKQGNIYTAGRFNGTIDLDSWSPNLTKTSLGFTDLFIAKKDALGNLLWVKTFGETNAQSSVAGMSVDASGNLVLSGIFLGTIDFDPGTDVHKLSASYDYHDSFLLKLSANGEYIWAKSFTGDNLQYVVDLATDRASNIYIAGYYTLTLDMDPGVGVSQLSSENGSRDVFVCKLNENGEFRWAKSIGGSAVDEPRAIELDNDGNPLITGLYGGTVDFNPGSGVQFSTSAGNTDIFILKLNPSGEFAWVKNFGGAKEDRGNDVACNAAGELYVCGKLGGAVDFGSSAGVFGSSASHSETFILKFDTSGNFIWATSFPAYQGSGMAFDSASNLYLTGDYSYKVDFDPGEGESKLTSYGWTGGYSTDTYLSKFSASGKFLWVIGIGGISGDFPVCVNIGANDNLILTGNYQMSADFDPGPGEKILTAASGSEGFVMSIGSETVLASAPLYFIAKHNDNGVKLSWQSFAGNNPGIYEVQRSEDSEGFRTIGSVNVSNKQNNHSFLDRISLEKGAVLYYRLKFFNNNQKEQYSGIVKVKLDFDADAVSLYPVPALNILNVSAGASFYGTPYAIYDINGNTVFSGHLTQHNLQLDISYLPVGVYMLKVQSPKSKSITFSKR